MKKALLALGIILGITATSAQAQQKVKLDPAGQPVEMATKKKARPNYAKLPKTQAQPQMAIIQQKQSADKQLMYRSDRKVRQAHGNVAKPVRIKGTTIKKSAVAMPR